MIVLDAGIGLGRVCAYGGPMAAYDLSFIRHRH
jgi:hypothetical protein